LTRSVINSADEEEEEEEDIGKRGDAACRLITIAGGRKVDKREPGREINQFPVRDSP